MSEKNITNKIVDLMIIDDSYESIKQLIAIFKHEPYNIRPANTGELALASIEVKKPDIILLDVMLPGINGFEVAERLKNNPRTKEIPIIFLTALNDSSNMERGYKSGGSDFISKPFDFNEVILRTRSHFEKQKLHNELREINRQLNVEIENRKYSESQLIKSEERLDLAMRVKNEGIWDWNLETDSVEFDDRYYLMAGYLPGDFPFALEEFTTRIHPDDQSMVMTIAEDYISGKRSNFIVEFRFLCKDESWIWVEGKGKIFEYTKDGKPKRFVGTHTDVSQRKKAEDSLRKSEERFRIAQEMSPEGFTILQPVRSETGEVIDFTWVYENQAIARINHTKPVEVIGKKLLDLFPKHRGTQVFETYIRAINTNEIQLIEEISVGDIVSGAKWLRMVIVPVNEEISILVEDITNRKIVEQKLLESVQKLKESENRLNMFFQQSLTGFFIMMLDEPVYWNDTVDKDKVLDYIFDHQRCTRVNQAMLDQYNMKLDDYLNKTPRDMFRHDIKSGKDAWRAMLDNKLIHIITDERKSDGTQIFIEGDYICMYDSFGRVIGHFGNQADVTLRIQKQNEIEYISNHDYLTDLYNRRYYFEQFKNLDQSMYYPLGIMMLDVNGLKIINDAFGHTDGDKALKLIGNILSGIFGKNDIIARIGGDEFAVLLPNSSEEKLQYCEDTLKNSLKNQKINNIELSLAIGYEVKNNTDYDIDYMLELAENHMYRHKSIIGSSSRNHAIQAILETLTDKYDTERRHSIEVSHLCRQIGQYLGLRDDELNELEQAGMFHDIGKISIPDAILNKPGKLTDEEYESIKTHTVVGYQILRAADEYSDLAIHALHHHERWDGKGYPSGLKGNDIPLFSRVIGVVDAFEAMTADRPYRKAMQYESAVKELNRCAGTQFDPNLVDIFVNKVLAND